MEHTVHDREGHLRNRASKERMHFSRSSGQMCQYHKACKFLTSTAKGHEQDQSEHQKRDTQSIVTNAKSHSSVEYRTARRMERRRDGRTCSRDVRKQPLRTRLALHSALIGCIVPKPASYTGLTFTMNPITSRVLRPYDANSTKRYNCNNSVKFTGMTYACRTQHPGPDSHSQSDTS
jgi:hypothetical protein